MNERIKELEERCWEELGEEEGMYPVFNTKKFAELIVKECAGIVNSLGQYEGPGDCSTAEYIKEHFGVQL